MEFINKKYLSDEPIVKETIFDTIKKMSIDELLVNINNNCIISLYQYGLYSLTGTHVVKNCKRAFNIFTYVGCECMLIDGIYMLAWCYQYGIGTMKHTDNAIFLYDLLVKANYNVAQYKLAEIYEYMHLN